MPSLASRLSDIVGAAFVEAGSAAEYGTVRLSDRPDLAPFQCNGAMAAAKAAKTNPRTLAQKVLEILERTPCPSQPQRKLFAKVEIAGPGFLNLTPGTPFLAAHLTSLAADPRLGIPAMGQPEKLVLDYGGPNVAKPMHVGHLRASIIGDALRRIAIFAGYNTLGDVHMGDWGLQMGQVISACALRHPEWPYFDESAQGPFPADPPFTFEALEEIYPAASKACKEDEARMDAARKATAQLQSGRPGYRALWQHIVDLSVVGMKQNFDALGVHFDLWKGEADVQARIPAMVERLQKDGWARPDQGAVVIPVARNDDKKEMPPLILLKSDGAAMYGTTDLATIDERVALYKPDRIVYVVDQRQSLHFEQLFRAAHLSGIAPPSLDLVYAGFGTMNGLDGKPFKTRAGGVMKLEDLIAMGLEKARTRIAEARLAEGMPPAEREDVARKVAIAALKFADLQNNRSADYIFDLDRMTAFEGKTGPYLLYQTVRIRSLLRKAQDAGPPLTPAPATPPVFILQDADRALALSLGEFPDAFALALREWAPHHLCDYAYRLAQSFSSFYAACHILSEENGDLRASRLALCDLTRRALETALALLGIGVPERM